MYCGMSLGTIGIDFRSLLLPIFFSHVSTLFSQSMDNAVAMFTRSIAANSWCAPAIRAILRVSFVDRYEFFLCGRIVTEQTLSKLGMTIPENSNFNMLPTILLYPPLAVLGGSLNVVMGQGV